MFVADDVVQTPDVDDPVPESTPSAEQFAPSPPVADTRQSAPRRVSRFDRPKEQHDWRWVLGHVGRALISLGVLMFAFVAYQLWGTGIQTGIEQDRLGDQFDQMLETTVPLTPVPLTTQPSATTIETVTSEAPAQSTTLVTPTTTVPQAVITAPPEGQPVARLNSPAMDLNDWEVVEGVSPADLQDGPGHFPETPLPGQLGNSAIAGHRTTHGAPFGKIDDLQAGDDIIVTTLAGQYTYVVTSKSIVAPSDYSLVIPTIDASKATLTLTSCHPAYSTRSRLVVFAELDLARSSQVTLAAPELGERDPSTLPSETVPAETVPAETVPAETVPVATTASSEAPAITATATTETPAAEPVAVVPVDPPDQSTDAFANRWFGDSKAFPQVALWGLLLIIVSLGAYAVSRRARRNWVGLVVGIMPFVVVLYYWFQNVNRLLPPNL